MRKLNIVVILLFMCILLVACSSPKEGQTPSESTGLTQLSAETENESGAEVEQIVLEPDNPYVEVSNIDFSSCKYENGYFTGEMCYTSHTTQKYVDEYNDYFYRQIYFGFYDESGNLVGDEISQDNYLYSREYTYSSTDHVMVATNRKIFKVEVLKIVCEKPSNK